MESSEKSVNKEEVMEIVKKYASEVFETSIFLPLSITTETKGAEKLWKATGKILIDIPKIEKIESKIVDLINAAVMTMQDGGKKPEGVEALSKIFDLVSFCFYINSYGKICAFHIVIPNANIPFEIPRGCNELKEKDLKDYTLRAKKFFEKVMNHPKYFDFVPLYGWCKTNNDVVIFAFVVFYSTFRAFFTSYRIEIVNDNIDIKALTEPVEI